MAATPISALLAQLTPQCLYYSYRNDAPQSAAAPPMPACDSQSQVPADEALDPAVEATNGKQMPTGVCWLKVAAAQNTPIAYGNLAAIYFKANGVPPDLEPVLVSRHELYLPP